MDDICKKPESQVKKSLEEEKIQYTYDDSTGFSIFSEEQTWFRHEKYEVYEYKEHIYIKPISRAEPKDYNPYEEYPDILEDFFIILDKMENKIHEKRRSGSSGIIISSISPIDKREARQLQIECAKILIEFYDKYGPLGVFFEDLIGLRSASDNRNLVFIQEGTHIDRSRLFFSDGKPSTNEQSGILEYDKYAKTFFPWLTFIPELYEEPISIYRLYDGNYNLSYDFRKHYSEEVTLIYRHELIFKLFQIISSVKEFDEYGTQAEDIAGPGTLFLESSFPGISQPILNSFMLTLLRDGKDIRIGWKAKSLLGILVLMFIENLTKQRNENLTVCKLNECMRLARGKAEYCCTKHGNRHRKRRQRASKENDIA